MPGWCIDRPPTTIPGPLFGPGIPFFNLLLPQRLFAGGQEVSRPPHQLAPPPVPFLRRHLHALAVLQVLGQVIRQPDHVLHMVAVDFDVAVGAGRRPPTFDHPLQLLPRPADRSNHRQVDVRLAVLELDPHVVLEGFDRRLAEVPAPLGEVLHVLGHQPVVRVLVVRQQQCEVEVGWSDGEGPPQDRGFFECVAPPTRFTRAALGSTRLWSAVRAIPLEFAVPVEMPERFEVRNTTIF